MVLHVPTQFLLEVLLILRGPRQNRDHAPQVGEKQQHQASPRRPDCAHHDENNTVKYVSSSSFPKLRVCVSVAANNKKDACVCNGSGGRNEDLIFWCNESFGFRLTRVSRSDFAA